jgi:hypothetical protein
VTRKQSRYSFSSHKCCGNIPEPIFFPGSKRYRYRIPDPDPQQKIKYLFLNPKTFTKLSENMIRDVYPGSQFRNPYLDFFRPEYQCQKSTGAATLPHKIFNLYSPDDQIPEPILVQKKTLSVIGNFHTCSATNPFRDGW